MYTYFRFRNIKNLARNDLARNGLARNGLARNDSALKIFLRQNTELEIELRLSGLF